MAEEIIGLLAKVPELKVPSRTSSFYFKGKSTQIPEIARQLGVSHVLEGSVRKFGNQLRVTVQLVRADSGYQLWSETYDRELSDVFKLQDDIAGAVVRALKVSLLTDEVTRSIPTSSTEAYTLYLQARDLFRRGAATDYRSAYEHLSQAVTLDPAFAAAWSEIARVRVRRWAAMTASTLGRDDESQKLLRKALARDPLEAFTYDTLADYSRQKGQWSEALKEGARAHDLMPEIFDESYIAQDALARGDPQRALSELSRVTSPIHALSLKERALRALGRKADADIALEQLEKLAATDGPAEIARIHALRDDVDAAFKWLDRAYELHDNALGSIKVVPDFNNLKTDPRFAAFLRKMRLPQ